MTFVLGVIAGVVGAIASLFGGAVYLATTDQNPQLDHGPNTDYED